MNETNVKYLIDVSTAAGCSLADKLKAAFCRDPTTVVSLTAEEYDIFLNHTIILNPNPLPETSSQ